MVDYRGPQFLRPVIQGLDIPIFDRVHQVDYRIRNSEGLRLTRRDYSNFQSLEKITATNNYGLPPMTDTQVQQLVDAVPPCRLEKADIVEGSLTIKVKPGFICCPDP